MTFTDLLMGTGLLLAIAGITVWTVIFFLRAMSPRFTDNTTLRPYWQAFPCKLPHVAVIGKPTRGFWRVFVWYIERFL